MPRPEKKEAGPLDPWIIDDILRKKREGQRDERPEATIQIDRPEIPAGGSNPEKEDGNWRRGVDTFEI